MGKDTHQPKKYMLHWKQKAVMMPTLSSPVAPELVITTSGDDKVDIMTIFRFKCMMQSPYNEASENCGHILFSLLDRASTCYRPWEEIHPHTNKLLWCCGVSEGAKWVINGLVDGYEPVCQEYYAFVTLCLLVNIHSGNDLLSNSTKPFPETIVHVTVNWIPQKELRSLKTRSSIWLLRCHWWHCKLW